MVAFSKHQRLFILPHRRQRICNALWFISLGLSLSCALIATLLEQWARDFLHRADMRSAPVFRARIYSYLYYGMKRFKMHTVVDIIPLLLHTSVFLFFAGLVAFLLPIDSRIAAVAATLLVVVVGVYFALTILPLRYLDCPYRTPLSTALWRISRSFWRSYRTTADGAEVTAETSSGETMVGAMSDQAMMVSPARNGRDYRALVWTVKSLSDDTELEPFVAGLPDVLWGPQRRRYAYEEHLQRLIRSPDLQLQLRIEGLLLSCNSGLLSLEANKRRRITCYKALWALASLATPADCLPLDFSRLAEHWESWIEEADQGMRHYTLSAVTLMKWRAFEYVKRHLDNIVEEVKAAIERGHPPDLHFFKLYISSTSSLRFLDFTMSEKLRTYVFGLNPSAAPVVPSLLEASLLLEDVLQAVEGFRTDTPHVILFDYIINSTFLESPPYRFTEIQHLITPGPFPALARDLEQALDDIVYSIAEHTLDTHHMEWIDVPVARLCSLWRPMDFSEPRPIPRALLHYLNHRKSQLVVENLLWRSGIGSHLFFCFPMTLSIAPSGEENTEVLTKMLTVLWRVASSSLWHFTSASPEPYQLILDAIADVHSAPLTPSVVALVKTLLVGSLSHENFPLGHPLLPTETAIDIPDESRSANLELLWRRRIFEARFVLFAEFLEACSAQFLPYEAAKTICYVGGFGPQVAVHSSHQLRLANSIHRTLNSDNINGAELLGAILSCPMFDVYAQHPYADPATLQFQRSRAWLGDPVARDKIKGTLRDRTATTSSGSPFLKRVQDILQGLDTLHADVTVR